MKFQFETAKNGPYKSRSGAIFGVCKGLAEYFDFSIFWMRFIVVVMFLFTGIWPALGVYLVAALIMKPEPIIPFDTESDKDFYETYTSNKTMGLHRLKRTFDNLDRRLKRMEDIVTGKEYDWDRRFHQKKS